MSRVGTSPAFEHDLDDALRLALAENDAALEAAEPVLRHLLTESDKSILSDEIVARVRGMSLHLARQLLRAQAEAAEASDPEDYVDGRFRGVAEAIMLDSALLRHLHCLAIEGQVGQLLHEMRAIDSVLPPLLQTLIGSEDGDVSAAAMHVLAAQARFVQSLRRMELPVGELPAPLFQAALACLMDNPQPEDAQTAEQATASLKHSFDEHPDRLSALQRLIAALGQDDRAALCVEQAGLALFASAVSAGAEQERDRVLLALSVRQQLRLALLLSAAGLSPQAIATELLSLHPYAELPEWLPRLTPEQSRSFLSPGNASRGTSAR